MADARSAADAGDWSPMVMPTTAGSGSMRWMNGSCTSMACSHLCTDASAGMCSDSLAHTSPSVLQTPSGVRKSSGQTTFAPPVVP